MKELENLAELHFEEFLEICSDSGLVTDEVAREIINFAKAIGGVGAIPRLTGKQLSGADGFETSLMSTYPAEMTFSNYVTTEENYYAAEIARTIALIPRVWKSITPVMMHAHTGQGKTHLMAAIARASTRKTLILNTVDLHIEYQHCLRAGMDRELREWISSFDLLLLDDVQFSQGDLQFQKFIISLINRMPRGTHAIITSSDVHPGKLLDIDASFYSRLTSGLIIKLETVNLEGRMEILTNMFAQTGVRVSDEVVRFIAENVTLNVRQLKAAGRMVLAQMLGPGSNVTLDSVREILGFMQLYAREQHGPKASELNVSEEAYEEEPAVVSHSPYIVVDIEEEKGDVADEPGRLEDAPKTVNIDEEHIFREETSPERSSHDGGTGKYRTMVESAETVENQIEALKQAVSERIEQLESRNADEREIEKLRFALAFLNEGRLESAMLALRPG